MKPTLARAIEYAAGQALNARLLGDRPPALTMAAGTALTTAIYRNALHSIGKGAAKEIGTVLPTEAQTEAIGATIATRLLDLARKEAPLTDAALYELGARSVKEVRNG
ncbi:MAG: hypothetical protein QM723_40635 [Myxococcaceae bacterium]